MLEKIVYKVGSVVAVRGQEMKIVRVYPFGTIDVVAANGKHYRLTGLPVYCAAEGA